tara:strand:- start:4926 stop:6170 length:1245 start_codon:yes stop_codon:yes gene_type:complete
MLFLYRFLINLVFLISPIILVIRLLKGKENLNRCMEKFCFFSKNRKKGKLIWFHGASVGEIQSIVPILEKLERENKIARVLITSNTLSSSKIVNKLKFKKIIHQFFPIDTNYFSSKFIQYWKPSAAYFIDSEIWPNTIMNLKKRKIPIMLINGRITNKSYKRWKILPNFSKYIFGQIDKCLPASNKSKVFLKKLGVSNTRFIGNLKFSQSENKKFKVHKKLRKFIYSRKTWCASSTHYSEEKFCGLIHKKLKKKYKNLLTIIIPRHIDRIKSIEGELNELGLKVQTHNPLKKINNNIDVYLVNSYGQTKSFFNTCKIVFLGGSIINHGGQNPLEATRYGCNILHGPNVENFTEIYKFLKKNKISSEIKNHRIALKKLDELLMKQNNSKNIQVKLKKIGEKILQKTYKEIIFLIK